MKLSMVSVLVALMVACVQVQSQDVDPAMTIAGSPVKINDATNSTPDPFVGSDNFYVGFDLIFFQDQIDNYPVTWENTYQALLEWSKHIPVRWMIFIDNPKLPFSMTDRSRSIQVHLTDIQEAEKSSDKLLGLWKASEGRILLDADSLESNPDKAYTVALHEFGHMLGVPHIVGFSEIGRSGFIVLPQGEDATNYVMYPRSLSEKPSKTLSQIEIALARHYLMYRWTNPGIRTDCQLYTTD